MQSDQIIAAAQRRLLTAANVWRVQQGFAPVPHPPSLGEPPETPPTGIGGAVACCEAPLAPVAVVPRRCDCADAARELVAIGRLQALLPTLRRTYHGRFGVIYNADNMSELLDVHGDERWEHHDAVRSSASVATQAAFDVALLESVTERNDVVVFSGGGNGSGKSTAVSGLPVGLGLDSTLSDFESSERNIDRALRTGRSVYIVFVHREPVSAFKHGVLTRLLDPLNGRPVPVRTHALTHAGARRTLLALAETFRGHSGVHIALLDNQTGEAPVERSLNWLASQPSTNAKTLETEVATALEAEVSMGRVSDRLARRLLAS